MTTGESQKNVPEPKSDDAVLLEEGETTDLNLKPDVTQVLVSDSTNENTPYYSLGVIGQVEPVYITPFEDAFPARIDTGAETSSIHAHDITPFERDGKRWVRFSLKQRETGIDHTFERPMVSKVKITRQEGDETRYKVNMRIRMGDVDMEREFSLADRSDFEFQVLIGRNVLEGNAVVDVSKSNLLIKADED
jgi:hypothetical protein